MRNKNTLDIEIMYDNDDIDTFTINTDDSMSEEKTVVGLLNPSFCRDFREAINSSPIFAYDPQYMAQYHLCCAVMDRLDTCIEKLNKYGEYPTSEEDFLVFMMFASMITDAVKEILGQLKIHRKKDPIYNSDNDYLFFKEAYLNSQIHNPNAEDPTDDAFFEYFRSLSFAHPAETSHHKFKRTNEVQYSPWVIVNQTTSRLRGYKDAVGVRIYTSLEPDIIDLRVSFASLKAYVKSRYERISLATQWAYEQIECAKANWRKTKINKNQSPLEIMREIDKVLDSRSERNYSIKEVIRYMECDLTDLSNLQNVNLYKEAMIGIIPKLCDAVDNLDHMGAEEICDELFDRPKIMHQFATYQLEKIYSYLGDNPSPNAAVEFLYALEQAQAFSEGFAKKWVHIDVNSMSHTEIQLLVRVACYLERKEQEQILHKKEKI